MFVAVATLISCSYRMSSDCRHTKGSISLSLGLGLSIWVDHYAVSVDDGHRVVCNFNLFVFFCHSVLVGGRAISQPSHHCNYMK